MYFKRIFQVLPVWKFYIKERDLRGSGMDCLRQYDPVSIGYFFRDLYRMLRACHCGNAQYDPYFCKTYRFSAWLGDCHSFYGTRETCRFADLFLAGRISVRRALRRYGSGKQKRTWRLRMERKKEKGSRTKYGTD